MPDSCLVDEIAVAAKSRPGHPALITPTSTLTWAEVDEMPSTVLMMAIGSPLTNALGIAGSVGSHSPSHFAAMSRAGERRKRAAGDFALSFRWEQRHAGQRGFEHLH